VSVHLAHVGANDTQHAATNSCAAATCSMMGGAHTVVVVLLKISCICCMDAQVLSRFGSGMLLCFHKD